MERTNFTLKGIRADEMSFKLNAVRAQNGARMELKPTFSRKVRRAVENEKICFVTLTVKIEKSDDQPKPFDLCVTFTGVFESDASTDAEKRAVVIGGTALLYGHMSALAGRPIASYAEGGAELFSQGFAFAFYVFGALSVVGVVLTVLAARSRLRR